MSWRTEDESERTEFHKLPDPEQVKAVRAILDPETDVHRAWVHVREIRARMEKAS